MLKKVLITSILTASVCAVMSANAALPAGLYVNGQIGYADTGVKSQVKSHSPDFANNGLAGRIAIGYKVTPNFAFELGYLQLSEGKSNFPPNLTLYNKQHAIDVDAKGILPITSNVNIYGKLGVAYLTTDLKENTKLAGFPPTSTDLNQIQGIAKHQWAPEVAIGMGYDITPNVTVDTSLTHIQPLGSNRAGNIDFLAVGIGYNFG